MVLHRTSPLHSLLFKLVLLLPVAILLQGVFGAVNRICFAGIIVLLFLYFVTRRYRFKDFLPFAILLCLYVWSLVVTDGTAHHFNDYFYFMFFVLYALYVAFEPQRLRDFCNENVGYILNVVRIWNAVVFISMFFSKSYKDGTFVSFTGDTFRSATSATFILALLTILVLKKRQYFFYALLPLYTILAGGTRTYLAVALVIFCLMFYSICGSTRQFVVLMVPTAIIMGILIANMGIMDKIESSLIVEDTDYYQDPLVKFTSGRSIFWAADMKAWWASGLPYQILGRGFNFVYDVNLVAINNKIWAHNDYINILLNFGLVGLGLYLYIYVKMMKAFKPELKRSKWLTFALVFVWFFNAFFNMFYTYFCAAASYPFLIIGVSEIVRVTREQREQGESDKATPGRPGVIRR